MAAERLASGLRRLMLFLASSRLAVVLLPIVVVLLALYLLVPQHGHGDPLDLELWIKQKGLVGLLFDKLWLTDIAHSFFFYAAYALLFVNLLFCMIQRFPLLLRTCRFPEELPRVNALWHEQAVEEGCLEAETVAKLLTRKGYRTRVEADLVYALRGRFSLIGSWVFHVSFLVLMLSGIYLLVTPTPFRGAVGIGEGEFFDLHTTGFIRTNRPVSPDLPGLSFQLEEIEVVTEGIDLRRFETTLSTPEGERATLGVNRPFRKPPYQVMVHGFGYMPGWVIVDLRQRRLHGAWLKLPPFPLEDEDVFDLGLENGVGHVRFYPDYEKVGEEHRSRGYQLRNPRFMVRLDVNGEEVFEGLLEPGQKVAIDGRMRFLFLPEIRMYSIVDVIYEKEYVAVFACLGGMILGLIYRYGRIRKEIWVQISDGSLSIAGRSELLHGLFSEELESLAEEIASVSRHGTAG